MMRGLSTADSMRSAPVAELVDARDSKSRSFGSVGSIPTGGTIFHIDQRRYSCTVAGVGAQKRWPLSKMIFHSPSEFLRQVEWK